MPKHLPGTARLYWFPRKSSSPKGRKNQCLLRALREGGVWPTDLILATAWEVGATTTPISQMRKRRLRQVLSLSKAHS